MHLGCCTLILICHFFHIVHTLAYDIFPANLLQCSLQFITCKGHQRGKLDKQGHKKPQIHEHDLVGTHQDTYLLLYPGFSEPISAASQVLVHWRKCTQFVFCWSRHRLYQAAGPVLPSHPVRCLLYLLTSALLGISGLQLQWKWHKDSQYSSWWKTEVTATSSPLYHLQMLSASVQVIHLTNGPSHFFVSCFQCIFISCDWGFSLFGNKSIELTSSMHAVHITFYIQEPVLLTVHSQETCPAAQGHFAEYHNVHRSLCTLALTMTISGNFMLRLHIGVWGASPRCTFGSLINAIRPTGSWLVSRTRTFMGRRFSLNAWKLM